jgi:hypothetical protein
MLTHIGGCSVPAESTAALKRGLPSAPSGRKSVPAPKFIEPASLMQLAHAQVLKQGMMAALMRSWPLDARLEHVATVRPSSVALMPRASHALVGRTPARLVTSLISFASSAWAERPQAPDGEETGTPWTGMHDNRVRIA